MDLLKLGLWSLLVKNGFCCHVYIVTASVEYFRWADQHLSVWSQLSLFVSAYVPFCIPFPPGLHCTKLLCHKQLFVFCTRLCTLALCGSLYIIDFISYLMSLPHQIMPLYSELFMPASTYPLHGLQSLSQNGIIQHSLVLCVWSWVKKNLILQMENRTCPT